MTKRFFLQPRLACAVLAAVLAVGTGEVHAQGLESQTIGGAEQLIGVWDLERTRDTATTPVTTTATLTVLQRIDSDRYRVLAESSSTQDMAENQEKWKKGRCARFGKRKQNPCRWTSRSRGVLTLEGRRATIQYDNPRYRTDDLTLRGGVMEGRDRNGPLTYVKRD